MSVRGYRRHGMSKTPLYKRWHSMLYRCSSPSHISYKHYGGRGITCCEMWNSFENFYLWAVESGYSEGLTIDRIDNDKGYSPENCRWATPTVQNRNTRRICKNNTTGYRGVIKNTWNLKAKRETWVARIRVNYKFINLGSFGSAEEAALAYDRYVIKNNLEHTLNFTQPEKG